MHDGQVLLEGGRFQLTMERLCYQLLENHGDFSQSCLIGVQLRGALFAEQLLARLQQIAPEYALPFGKLDVTFYRDDFRMHDKPLNPYPTQMDFLVDKKRVILVDDVLYSGRTTRAALDALQHYGRPDQVELMVLVDRRFNRLLPVQPDYTGIAVDALNDEYIKVEWENKHGQDRVLWYAKKV